MNQFKQTKQLVLISLFTALCCVTTLFPHIPTPTMGYIHAGDGMVILSGILLGPAGGAFAAGVGSMLADIFSGYVSYAPATLLIKAGSALLASLASSALGKWSISPKKDSTHRPHLVAVILGGVFGEAFMVAGYFLYETWLLSLSSQGEGSLASGALAAAASIPFNAIQGLFGVLIASGLYPLLSRMAHPER